MLYAILCYKDEDVVSAWTKAEDDAVMARLETVHEPLRRAGKLGPSARLLPTSAATTLRNTAEPIVLDGPFAETKEQFLGFYMVEVADLEEAIAIARDLGAVNPGGSYEVRPVRLYLPDPRPAP